MTIRKVLLSFLLAGTVCDVSVGQFSAAFQSLIYPRSIVSSGLGEQGVASRSAFAAMQYNPANLVYSREIEVSYFRNPWNIIGPGFPLSAINVAIGLGSHANVGIEYTVWDLGEYSISSPTSPITERLQAYERSVAAGYALFLDEQTAIGAQVRYVWQPVGLKQTVNHLLFSAGVSYRPEMLSGRLNAGLSFMNFGTPLEYPGSSERTGGQSIEIVSTEPPPAQILLGIEGRPVANDFFDVSLSLGASKPLDKRNGAPDYKAQSSFTSLFNDWTDFPDDMTGRIGMGFVWHPIDLGAGISYFQNIYLGYFSSGPRDLSNCFYTHGLAIGLEGYGVRATAGYAGRWHNNNPASYLAWQFPWETFQFTLSTDMSLLGDAREGTASKAEPHEIILTAGYSYALPVGKMHEAIFAGGKVSFSTSTFWSVEADFYIDDKAAIVSSFGYSRMTENFSIRQYPFSYSPSPYGLDIGIETFSLESGFRYHPIDAYLPVFFQVTLGVIRMNPVYANTYPRYFYKTFDKLAIGSVLRAGDLGIVLVPRVGLRTLFLEEFSNGRWLGGYNQWEFGLDAGVAL